MLDNLTFVTPLQIESQDRLRNAITIFSYLSKNFPESKIIVKEIDIESKFLSFVLPEVENLVGTSHNIKHIFERSDELFNKSKVINDMVLMSETDIVFNYDVDVMMPVDSYKNSYNMLISGDFDIVYPYGCGVYLYNISGYDKIFEHFISSDFTLTNLIPYGQRLPSVQGWCQMFNKQKFLKNYGFNENFVFVGYEDTEFLYRMQMLGLKVGRVNNDIYHLDHVRIKNSNYCNPNIYANSINLFNFIKTLNKQDLIEYYKKQDYIKKFIGE